MPAGNLDAEIVVDRDCMLQQSMKQPFDLQSCVAARAHETAADHIEPFFRIFHNVMEARRVVIGGDDQLETVGADCALVAARPDWLIEARQRVVGFVLDLEALPPRRIVRAFENGAQALPMQAVLTNRAGIVEHGGHQIEEADEG